MTHPEGWQGTVRTHRHVVTTVTMVLGVLVLVAMASLGLKELKEPYGSQETKAECPAEDVVRITHVMRREVTVSVYNAGGAQGVAGRTLERLEGAGFRPGEVGNAPSEVVLDSAVVYTTEEDDARARLVARFMGGIPVKVVEDEHGPGVDVFLGKRKEKLDPKAPRRIALTEPIVRCDKS